MVEEVLNSPECFDELFSCYQSDNETVKLRVSNAMKRIVAAKPEMILPYLDRFIDEVSVLEQPSAQRTFSQLMLTVQSELSITQRNQTISIIFRYLQDSSDWIVLTTSMKTLAEWAKDDQSVKTKLLPYLQHLTQDSRKSVS